MSKLKVGISVGDLNGVGMEIIFKTFRNRAMNDMCTPIVFGNAKAAGFYRKATKSNEFSFNIVNSVSEISVDKANLVAISNEEISLTPGTASKQTGAFAAQSLKAATEALSKGEVDVLVTAPIDKNTIQSADFNFPGHTEYLTNFAGEKESLMFMVSENIRVATLSNHVALKDVVHDISQDKIKAKLDILIKSLQDDFGVVKPKVAVLGLNPHAGDNGQIGEEEKEIIIPALKAYNQNDAIVMGPYSADGFFGNGSYKQFDAVLSMYHDQGLVPFKILSFGSGVNFTAGLPVVRTSPDHGVAYDIAGKNTVDENSFRQAIYMAIDVFKMRKKLKEWRENPLEHHELKVDRK
jgi:4-hydroxythreonine-4-phosphate dehydrogenase